MSASGPGTPPGLTAEIVDRCGQIVREAASRALAGKPVNPYELANAAAALLGTPPPQWSAPSEFPDTSRGGGPMRVGDGEPWRELERAVEIRVRPREGHDEEQTAQDVHERLHFGAPR